MPTLPDPTAGEDTEYVDLSEAAAVAGSTERTIDELAQGYSPDPGLAVAIEAAEAAGGFTGTVTVQSPAHDAGSGEVILAGSADAAAVVAGYSKPLVGAGPPTVQTTAQLAQRFDGLNSGVADSTFPTPQ